MAEGQVAAWITVVAEDEAMERARQLEDEGAQGRALWGVPFAVKDNIDVAGMPTTVACPAFAYPAQETAPAVQRLLDAGANLVGKTNLDQFATGLVGTRSPYGTCHSVLDPRLIAGGSSSGSAVAVAEGVVPFALGTDTAGSGRVPAACNGIVGLKPTRGLISIRGVVPACRSIDCLSIFARSVADAVAVLDVLSGVGSSDAAGQLDAGRARGRTGLRHAGHSGAGGDAGHQQAGARWSTGPTSPAAPAAPATPTSPSTTSPASGREAHSQPLGAAARSQAGRATDKSSAADPPWRVGVPPEPSWGLAPAQAAAYAEVVADVAGWAEVRDVDLSPLLEAGELLYGGPFVAERLTTIGPLLARDPEAVHPIVRRVVSRGLDHTAVDVFADLHRLDDLRERLHPVWDDVDVLLCPTLPDIPTLAAVEAAPIGANAALGRWTNGVNLLDLCALTVPAGRRPDGLPGSVTLVGPAGHDLALAAAAQRMTGRSP